MDTTAPQSVLNDRKLLTTSYIDFNGEDELSQFVSEINPPQLASNSQTENPDIQLEKVESYKRNLEQGMREFLVSKMPNLKDLEQTGYNQLRTNYLPPKMVSNEPKREHVSKQHSAATETECREENSGRYTAHVETQQDPGFSFKSGKLPQVDFEGNLMLEEAGGFLMILDRNLMIISASENISQYLGFSQIQVIGHHIYDFLLPQDVHTFKKCTSWNGPCKDADTEAMFDSGETKRRFTLALKHRFHNGSYEWIGSSVFQWSVRLILCRDTESDWMNLEGLVCLCSQVSTNSITHIHNDGFMLTYRLSLDFDIIGVDPRLESVTGFKPEDLKYKSVTSLKHPCDAYVLSQYRVTILTEGKGVSPFFRTYNKNGDPVWVYNTSEVVKDKQNRPNYIISHLFLVSPREAERILRQDEEEYKRFNCQGFGRLYTTEHQSPKVDPTASPDPQAKTPSAFQEGMDTFPISDRMLHSSFNKLDTQSTFIFPWRTSTAPKIKRKMPISCDRARSPQDSFGGHSTQLSRIQKDNRHTSRRRINTRRYPQLTSPMSTQFEFNCKSDMELGQDCTSPINQTFLPLTSSTCLEVQAISLKPVLSLKDVKPDVKIGTGQFTPPGVCHEDATNNKGYFKTGFKLSTDFVPLSTSTSFHGVEHQTDYEDSFSRFEGIKPPTNTDSDQFTSLDMSQNGGTDSRLYDSVWCKREIDGSGNDNEEPLMSTQFLPPPASVQFKTLEHVGIPEDHSSCNGEIKPPSTTQSDLSTPIGVFHKDRTNTCVSDKKVFQFLTEILTASNSTNFTGLESQSVTDDHISSTFENSNSSTNTESGQPISLVVNHKGEIDYCARAIDNNNLSESQGCSQQFRQGTSKYIPQLSVDEVDRTINLLKVHNFEYRKSTVPITQNSDIPTVRCVHSRCSPTKCQCCGRGQRPLSYLGQLLEEDDDTPTSPFNIWL